MKSTNHENKNNENFNKMCVAHIGDAGRERVKIGNEN
jgi:hypothetical protein